MICQPTSIGVKHNNITIHPPSTNCGIVCEKILRALPDWFGIEESLLQYVEDANVMPTLLAKDDSDNVLGFITIKRHYPDSAEIHCMGILPQYHRKGIGKLLIEELENHLNSDGVKILQVKTLSEDRECIAYAKTRAFYRSVGFTPLEVFPTFWDKANPCLVLVKQI